MVCRSLGYTSANSAPGQAYFGQASNLISITLDDVQCTGNETNLAYCGHSGYNKHNCGHNEDAGVICGDPGDL